MRERIVPDHEAAQHIRTRSQRYPNTVDIDPAWTVEAVDDPERLLRELLNGWDPIGVADIAPTDEYDCLIPGLRTRLSRGDDAGRLRAFLTRRLDQHFGLDSSLLAESTREFVERLVSRRPARWPAGSGVDAVAPRSAKRWT